MQPLTRFKRKNFKANFPFSSFGEKNPSNSLAGKAFVGFVNFEAPLVLLNYKRSNHCKHQT